MALSPHGTAAAAPQGGAPDATQQQMQQRRLVQAVLFAAVMAVGVPATHLGPRIRTKLSEAKARSDAQGRSQRKWGLRQQGRA